MLHATHYIQGPDCYCYPLDASGRCPGLTYAGPGARLYFTTRRAAAAVWCVLPSGYTIHTI